MAYTTVVTGTAITASWGNANVRDQVVTPFTDSAARASAITAPVDGMVSTLTTTDRIDIYNGTSWSAIVAPSNGALTTYTPTLTQSATITKTVTKASYIRSGRWVEGSVTLAATSAGTAANAIAIGLPVTAAESASTMVGTAFWYDLSATLVYHGAAVLSSSSTIGIYVYNNPFVFAGATGSVSTQAVASGDILSVNFGYEVAADG